MKTNMIIRLALTFSLPVFSALAQTNTPPPSDGPGGGRHHRPPPMPIVMALDTNRDGIISADEIANAPAALKTLDKNGDGQLTKDEYMPPRPDGMGGRRGGGQDGPPPGADDNQGPPGAGANDQQGPGGHKRPLPPIITALDANHDGIISADEIANASAALKTLDKNGDGQLTRDEYMPPRPQGMGGGPGGPDDGQGPPQGEGRGPRNGPPGDDGGGNPPPQN